MKKKILMILAIGCLILSACSSNKNLKLKAVESSPIDNMSLYVSLTASDYQDGMLTVKLFNQSGYTMIYGEEYALQKLDGEEWVDVKAPKDYTWHDLAHEIKDMETIELKYDLNVFGKLKPGKYRLVKNDMAAEFELEKK